MAKTKTERVALDVIACIKKIIKQNPIKYSSVHDFIDRTLREKILTELNGGGGHENKAN